MSHTRAPEAISETMTELEDHETIASDKKRPDIHDHEHYLTVDDRQSSIRYSSTMRESRLYEHRARAISNAYTSIHEGTGEGEEGGGGFHQGRQRTSSAYRASSCLKSLAVMSCHTFLDEEELELAHQTKSGMKEPFSTQLMMTFPPQLCCATTADDDDEDDCGDSHYTKLYDDTDVDDDSNNTNNTSSCCSISLNARSFLVFVVSVALFVDYLLLTIIIPILHVVLGDLSSLYIGLLFATKPAMQIVFNFFVANFDPYSLMLYGAVVEAGTTLAFGFGTEYWHFALARGLQGAASACVMTGGMTLILATHPAEPASLRREATANAFGGLTLGVLSGPPIGGLLYHYIGFSECFILVAAVLSIDILLLLCISTDTLTKLCAVTTADNQANQADNACRKSGGSPSSIPSPGSTSSPSPGAASVWRVVTDPYMLSVGGCMFFQHMVIGMLESTFPKQLEASFDFHALDQGLFFALLPLCHMLGTAIIGRVRIAYWKCITFGILLTATGIGCLSYSPADVRIYAIGTAMVGAGAAAVITPIQPFIGLMFDYRGYSNYAVGFAFTDTMQSAGFLIGPLLGGFVVDEFGFAKACLFSSILLFAYFPYQFLLRRVPH